MFTTNFAKNPFFTAKNPFFVGPLRSYQEKCWQVYTSWTEVVKSCAACANLTGAYWQNVVAGMSEQSEKFAVPSNFSEVLEQLDRTLEYSDKCWEEVMKSEDYAQKNTALLDSLLQWQKSCQALADTGLATLPIASQSQLDKLIDKVQRLEKKLDALSEEGGEA